MTFQERLNNTNINLGDVVFELSYADATCIVEDNLSQEQLESITDKQLEDMIKAVAYNFGNIDWYEWGQTGFDCHLWDNPIEEEKK